MLVPLLGIPNIMQTIPFTPNNENINYFAVYTYIASIFYMFQVPAPLFHPPRNQGLNWEGWIC